VYIVATLLRKAIESPFETSVPDDLWKALMLAPVDYGDEALVNPLTRQIMEKISFEHGGPEYDARYPDGIPTSVVVTSGGESFDSGLIMYPLGHARNVVSDLDGALAHKFLMHGSLGLPEGSDVSAAVAKLNRLDQMSADELIGIYG